MCRGKKGLDEMIDDSMLQCFGLVERMERDRIAKRVCVGDCAGRHSVGRSRERWTDTVRECLKKNCLDVREARRMAQDRSEWQRFGRRNA